MNILNRIFIEHVQILRNLQKVKKNRPFPYDSLLKTICIECNRYNLPNSIWWKLKVIFNKLKRTKIVQNIFSKIILNLLLNTRDRFVIFLLFKPKLHIMVKISFFRQVNLFSAPPAVGRDKTNDSLPVFFKVHTYQYHLQVFSFSQWIRDL